MKGIALRKYICTKSTIIRMSRVLSIIIVLLIAACQNDNPLLAPKANFLLDCLTIRVDVPSGQNYITGCWVETNARFSSPITFNCQDLPPGFTCSFNPNYVFLDKTNTASVDIYIKADPDVPAGDYDIKVVAVSDSTRVYSEIKIRLIKFQLICLQPHLNIRIGSSGTTQCTLYTYGILNQDITFACKGAPAGVHCSFQPEVIPHSPDRTYPVNLTMKVGKAMPNSYEFNIQAYSNNLISENSFSLNVIPTNASFTISCKSSWSLNCNNGYDEGKCTVTAYDFCGEIYFGCIIVSSCQLSCWPINSGDERICNEKKSIFLKLSDLSPPWCQCPPNGTYPLDIIVWAFDGGVTAEYNATINIHN